jgi:hypothetical protein
MKFLTFSGDNTPNTFEQAMYPLTSLDQYGQRHTWAAPPPDSEPLQGQSIYLFVRFAATHNKATCLPAKDCEEMEALGGRIAILPRPDQASPTEIQKVRDDLYNKRTWEQASPETRAYFDRRAIGGRLLKKPFLAPVEQSATTTLFGSLAVGALVAALVATSGLSNKPKLAPIAR